MARVSAVDTRPGGEADALQPPTDDASSSSSSSDEEISGGTTTSATYTVVRGWTRLRAGGRWSAATNRSVDTAAVVDLLVERASSKASKDFARADEIALKLQLLDICYLDGQGQWYARKRGEKTKKNMRPADRKREPGHKRKRRRRRKEFEHEHAPLK